MCASFWVNLQRAPDKRPPAVVSSVFTTLALLPLLLVVTYVAFGMGVNFNVRGRLGTTSHLRGSVELVTPPLPTHPPPPPC